MADLLRLGAIVAHFLPSGTGAPANPSFSSDPDGLMVAVTVSGETLGGIGEGEVRGPPGSLRLTDLSQASAQVPKTGRTILIAVPRPVVEARGLSVRALHGRVVQSGLSATLMLLMLGMRLAAPELRPEDGIVLQGTVLDLLGLAVKAPTSAPGGREDARATAEFVTRAAIEHDIDLSDLSVAKLCRYLQISRSTLHRLFKAEGGAQAYIRGRRLEAAYRALQDSDNVEPIYLLAERLGFSDSSHLNRLFRARYGLTPGDLRRRAAGRRGLRSGPGYRDG